jgi:hypothetical protein
MNVQELKDFLEAVNPDPESEVLVSIQGKVHTPRLTYSPGGVLSLEIPRGVSKRKAPKRKKAR